VRPLVRAGHFRYTQVAIFAICNLANRDKISEIADLKSSGIAVAYCKVSLLLLRYCSEKGGKWLIKEVWIGKDDQKTMMSKKGKTFETVPCLNQKLKVQ
jgi:hypothetical protein